MSKKVLSDTVQENHFAPVLDGDKLNVEKTATLAAQLLLDDALLGPSGRKGKAIYQQKLMASVSDMDKQLEKYISLDPSLGNKFEDRLKTKIEIDLHENKLLYTFLKAATPRNHRFYNKMSYRQLENKIDSANNQHHPVEHSLLALIKLERNRSSQLKEVVSKLNPFNWLDTQCESLMYSWFILEGIK